MATRPDLEPDPDPDSELSATEIVREMNERLDPIRERVLRNIERLGEIAEIKSRRRYWYW
jgi:hypothetical protein